MAVKVKAVHDFSVTVGDGDATWIHAASVKISRRRIIGQNDNVNAEDLVAAFPIKLAGTSGAPARVVGIEFEN